jgi:Transposase IS4
MELRRSRREPRPKTSWEQKGASPAAEDPKITKKSARAEKKTALKPIAAGPLPEAINLDEKQLPELPTYHPPLELRFQPAESLATGLPELHTFQKLLTPAIIEAIVQATNSYAQTARETDQELPFARAWLSVNSTDIWRYIGCLLYMRYHRKNRYKEH